MDIQLEEKNSSTKVKDCVCKYNATNKSTVILELSLPIMSYSDAILNLWRTNLFCIPTIVTFQFLSGKITNKTLEEVWIVTWCFPGILLREFWHSEDQNKSY